MLRPCSWQVYSLKHCRVFVVCEVYTKWELSSFLKAIRRKMHHTPSVFVVSAVDFAPYLTGLSSMMLI